MDFDIDYASSVIKLEADGVKSMSKVVQSKAFCQALKVTYNTTGSVVVTGIGKAGIIGGKISATMASTGTPSHFLHPAEAIHGDLGKLQDNDIVLALSFSGESEEVIRLINPIKQRGIKLLAITKDKKSTLGKHSDIAVCLGDLCEACPLGIVPSVSTVCMLAIGDAIALTVMKARNFNTQDYARFHPGGAIGANLITVGQSMMFQRGAELPLAMTTDTIEQMLKKTDHLGRRGSAMITTPDSKLAGIITDADLRRALNKYGSKALKSNVTEIMTANCKYVFEETLASEAMAIFHKYRIDELPVVDKKNRPIGLIDVQDIIAIKVVR
ncbi:MAG: KpsF/GutQ family sugar-phosphate isomerase [Planctomycetota bacterium]|jgi:arabinose-5-phosphate isomerase